MEASSRPESFQEQATRCLLKLWGRPNSSRAPVPLPVSLDRATLVRIRSRAKDFWVSPKADGERCFVLLGCYTDPKARVTTVLRNPDGTPRRLAALVDRRGVATDVLPLLSALPLEWFAGTLVDAERMSDKTLLAFDAVAIKGRSMLSKTYAQTRSALESLEREWRCPLVLRLKRAARPSGVGGRAECRRILESGGEGSVLTDNFRVLAPGPMQTILKFKNVHTVDLGVDSLGRVFVGDRGSAIEGLPERWKPLTSLRLRVPAEAKACARPFAIVELAFGDPTPDGGRDTRFVSLRQDKIYPNTEATLRSTWKAHEESLAGSDVADAMGW